MYAFYLQSYEQLAHLTSWRTELLTNKKLFQLVCAQSKTKNKQMRTNSLLCIINSSIDGIFCRIYQNLCATCANVCMHLEHTEIEIATWFFHLFQHTILFHIVRKGKMESKRVIIDRGASSRGSKTKRIRQNCKQRALPLIFSIFIALRV